MKDSRKNGLEIEVDPDDIAFFWLDYLLSLLGGVKF